VEDPHGGWHRSRPATLRADLATVPYHASPRDLRG
jgi:hypothetical protein